MISGHADNGTSHKAVTIDDSLQRQPSGMPDPVTGIQASERTDTERTGPLALFDWRNPHYAPIWAKRMRILSKLRDPERGPQYLQAMLHFYRAGNIDCMIEDWGVTYDPRNAALKRPITMPFVLFPKQREFIQWLWRHFKEQSDGIAVKSRDCGASWLAMAFAACMCRLFDNVSFGFGSAIEDKVDRSGDPDCLFWKGRKFIEGLPRELRGPWDIRKNNAHMRTWWHDTNSSITGEAGDRIGRGGRKTMYFMDEFAFVEHPKIIDSNLLANTDCRIEISTVNGLANVFAERARGGLIDRFDFHYRDDPRKVDPVTLQLWPEFAAKKASADPTNWSQEYECDFAASVEGVLIPQVWVQAAVGAAAKLGIQPSGVRRGSWDIADAGKDKNAFAFRHGIQLEEIYEWPGQEAQMLASVRNTLEHTQTHQCAELYYDKDGMGAPASSMIAQEIGVLRKQNPKYRLTVVGFRGSGAVLDPESKTPGTDRKNEDYLENQKAQSWMALRWRFWKTYQWVVERVPCDPGEIISLNPRMKLLTKLTGELSQPTRTWSKTGKLMVDKTPDDVASPNLADACMMAFSYQRPPLTFSNELLEVT